jgi:glycerol-1-phosphate dehydrogenase [NAD(P)+]
LSTETLDLTALRERLASAPDAARLQPLGLGRVIAGPDALGELALALVELRASASAGTDSPAGPAGPIALLVDATPMLRGDVDLKPAVHELLAAEAEVREVVVGPPGAEVHADEPTLAAARAAAAGSALLVSVGSGTVSDIGKALAADLDLPHVVVATAASVNGFADDQSVLLRSGVKRTTPTRWPDLLVLDGPILASAPRQMNLGGLGDLVSMFTACPDWLLAREVGMDESFSETAVAIGRDHGEELLAMGPALAANDPDAVVRLAEILALSGISMGVAGRTAPSSGMEHTVSHLLEMAADRRGVGAALHGAQVGVTTVMAALVWRHLEARIAEGGLAFDFPSPAAMEERVHAAFDPLDPSGAMAAECWSDYERKLARWSESRPRLERLAVEWDSLWPRFEALLGDPEEIAAALDAAGAPVRFSDLDPAVDAATARWALANCHLMRDRFTVADLAFFAGHWEEADVEAVLAAAESLGAGL